MSMKKPSEQILENEYDGKLIEDSKGRILTLRKPNILDTYDLMSALGDDAKSQACMQMAMKVLYVAKIDDVLIQSPKSYAEFRATLQRIGSEGIVALMDFMTSFEETPSEKEQIEKAKKS